MKRLYLLFLLFLPALFLACSADDASQEEPVLEGPALVMWYTDN
ncbi:MAG: hypothetical protein RRC07_01250 [Anaerolineae bacterium]|nr:hypothetical protein [Anaerolineae bacterium]